MTTKIQKAIKDRYYHLKKARKTNKEIHWSTYRRLKNSVINMIRSSKSKLHKTSLQENINDPKAFWKHVKNCFPTKTNQTPTSKSFVVNGELISNDKAIANGFCSFFSNIGILLQNGVISIQDRIWQNHDKERISLENKVNPKKKRFTFKVVFLRDVLSALKRLKSGKCAGYDNLPPNLIKYGAEEIAYPLCDLINKSLLTSTFPTCEKNW